MSAAPSHAGKEILPGVVQFKQDLAPVWPGSFAALTLVIGQRMALIDSGLPGGDVLVWPFLEAIGRPPTDVVAIVNTHFHGDHTGSNAELRLRSHARVMIHALDAPQLGSGPLEGPAAGPADVLLEDGDVVDLGDRELRIVHLPGHTAGSIGVHLPEQRALFTGDSLQARGTSVQYIASYADPDAYVASVKRVLDMDLQHLGPGHAFAPFSDSYLQGSEVRRFLEISLEHALEMDDVILDVLRIASTPLDVPSVAAGVCARFGFASSSPMANSTVGAHLRRLAEAGRVTASAAPDVLYRARSG